MKMVTEPKKFAMVSLAASAIAIPPTPAPSKIDFTSWLRMLSMI